ncbi:AMP-binding protein [Oceanicella actignis]|uniref:Acyl-CoA synthetase (AMP-forming)/AMP-acid ligase II n=1 Tax=Oceanicella actignis TaxID=1189325 RepID=A0A1M7SU22_9RHOB|nr:AMP-binding protein [Oceanicella actignis]SES71095.1 AMP-binding enzyme C-terminal domain-containing protein [Oceanicella actignis]SHN62043.1 Acyl-CoA synthetase (AMP-forming)/AMP-acid ligase II [Oceanicella actignis]
MNTPRAASAPHPPAPRLEWRGVAAFGARRIGPEEAQARIRELAARLAPAGPALAIPAEDPAEAMLALFAALAAGRDACVAEARQIERLARGGDAACLEPFADALSRAAGADRGPKANPAPGRLICFSSGVTGAPKAVLRSQASWIASFGAQAPDGAPRAGETVAIVGTPAHSLPLYAAAEALHLGATALFLTGLAPRAQMRAAQDADILWATPTQLRLMAAAGPPAARPRLALSGGAALDAAARAEAARAFPSARLLSFYGAVETSFVAIAGPDDPPEAAGRPFAGVELRLRAEDGALAAPGRPGRVEVRSPYLCEGPALGAPAPERTPDGFVRLPEIGRIDGAGRLILLGRAARMTVIAGRNVHLEEVEAALAALPGVTAAAALALPDPLRGARLAVAVHAPQADDAARAARLEALCRAALGPELSPRRVAVLTSWPMLPAGKTDLERIAQLLGAESRPPARPPRRRARPAAGRA